MLANYADLVNYEKIKTSSAVIAVLAVLKTAITAKTAETARYIQRIYSLIFREKWSCDGFLRTFLEGVRKCPQKVRGMEVIRLLGDKANPYNRMKKNRLCGLVV